MIRHPKSLLISILVHTILVSTILFAWKNYSDSQKVEQDKKLCLKLSDVVAASELIKPKPEPKKVEQPKPKPDTKKVEQPKPKPKPVEKKPEPKPVAKKKPLPKKKAPPKVAKKPAPKPKKPPVDALEQAIAGFVAEHARSVEAPVITRQRHRARLQDGLRSLETARDALANDVGAELAAEDVRMALRQLGSIIGVVGVEDVLGAVFSAFCIGK